MSEKKKYQVGIIGCGSIFVMHAASLKHMEDVEVTAVCDIDPTAAEMGAAYMQCKAYTDYKVMLKSEDLDTVHILTPHFLHHRMSIDAMKAGMHVLVEKPMAIQVSDAEEMNRVSKETGKILGIVSQNRYNAASLAIKKALSEPKLGRVLSEKVILTWAKPKEYYLNSEWRGTWEQEGGSLLIDQSVHVLDLARWFIDSPITSIDATVSNRSHPEIETEDTAEGKISFENGAYILFFASNCYSTNSPVQIEIHCEYGIITMDGDTACISYNDGTELTVTNDPADSFEYGEFRGYIGASEMNMAMEAMQKWGLAEVPIPATWKQPKPYWGFSHIRQIREFYESVTTGSLPLVNGYEAIKTQKMIAGIYQAGAKHE